VIAILRLLVFLLAAMSLPPVGLAASAAAVREQKLHDQYEASLQKLKPDDDQGRAALARWCRQNKLTREAEELWQGLLQRRRDELAANPTAAGYLALAAWCDGAGLTQAAAEARRDAARFEYAQKKTALNPGDPAALLALANWCQQRRLVPEAVESLQALLRIAPSNTAARTRLESIRTAAWREAPTGLLKKQTVPGYTNAAAWYHISVPAEYRADKGLPLVLYLHGGAHGEGTADNVVALAQVMPPFKKAIVVFPNHLRTWWAHPREMTDLVDTLDNVMLRWRVDPKRIYLMGASMGGNGVWGFGCRCPELFAALSPISGFYAGFLEFPIENLRAKPVYILHGTKDSTVPIGGAREAFGILKKLNAPVEMREPDCEHQPPTGELTRAAEWLLKRTNSETFDLPAIRERVGKVPVAGWLKQYPGN
jgi:acetyl esterase/lipase